MNVERQIAHMTVRLLVTAKDGSQHSGTGFLLGYDIGGGQAKVFCVTNRHVLLDAKACNITVTRQGPTGDPLYGQVATVDVTEIDAATLFHPDPAIDLAAFAIHGIINQIEAQGITPFVRVINRNEIPDTNFFRSLDVANDVIMIGYPNGLWDEQNNMPIIRRGLTATSPSLDFNGRPEFVIDCACFPGSSGSPIFLFQNGGYKNESNNYIIGQSRILLIGILYAGPQFTVSGEIVAKTIPTKTSLEVKSMVMMHLGYCIKSTELRWLDAIVASG